MVLSLQIRALAEADRSCVHGEQVARGSVAHSSMEAVVSGHGFTVKVSLS